MWAFIWNIGTRGSDEDERFELARDMGQFPKWWKTQLLKGALTDQLLRVRLAAVESLGYHDSPAAIKIICGALKSDTDPRVRSACATLLGRTTAPGALAALKSALRDPDNTTRQEAVKALGARRDPKLAEALQSLIKDPDPSIRREVALSLGKSGDSDCVQLLIQMLNDREDQVFLDVRSSLVAQRSDTALQALIGTLEHPTPAMRARALATLRKLDDKRAIPAISGALHDPDYVVRLEVVKTLAVFKNDEDAQVGLKVATEDQHQQVADAAQQALKGEKLISYESKAPPKKDLIKNITEENPTVLAEEAEEEPNAAPGWLDGLNAPDDGPTVEPIGDGPAFGKRTPSKAQQLKEDKRIKDSDLEVKHQSGARLTETAEEDVTMETPGPEIFSPSNQKKDTLEEAVISEEDATMAVDPELLEAVKKQEAESPVDSDDEAEDETPSAGSEVPDSESVTELAPSLVAAQFGESSSSSGDNRAMVEMVVARLTHAHDSQVQEAIKAIRDMGSQFAIPPLLRLLRQAKQVEIVIGLLEHLLREGVRDLSDEYLLELSSLSAEEIIEDLEAQQSVAPAEDETMSFPVMDLSKIRKMATAEMERRDYQTAS